MPILELIWVLLAFLVYLDPSIAVYRDTVRQRSHLLTDILLDESNMPTQKRSHHGGGRDGLNTGDLSDTQECCPSITQGIAPLGGLSRDGTLLQLYRDDAQVQKFYETTCAEDIENQPCRFVNQTVWFSRCEQMYTYTYAVVKNFNVTQSYRIDYMKLKSGCSCKVNGRVEPPAKSLAEELIEELTEELLEEADEIVG